MISWEAQNAKEGYNSGNSRPLRYWARREGNGRGEDEGSKGEEHCADEKYR